MTFQSTLLRCAPVAIALFLVLSPANPQAQGRGGPPAQPGQQGGVTALQAQVQALEAGIADLSAALNALTIAVGSGDATLQGQITTLGGQLAGFQGQLAALTTALSTTTTPIAGLQTQVQALVTQTADLRAALATLTTRVGTLDDAIQAQVSNVSAELTGFQQLLDQFNQGLSTAEGKITSLQGKVADLEAQLAALGGGLTSYDQLAGLPCTTAIGTQRTVNLVGLLKSPMCADAISANGRFVDFGLVVLDTQTNLIWEKKTTAVGSGANAADLHDVDNKYFWCGATGNSAGFCGGNATSWIGQVNAEVFAGFSNWRVPTPNELLTIVDMNTGPPRIDTIFGPTAASFYWSNQHTPNDAFAWRVPFGDGVAGNANKVSLALHVRAVRSGQ